MDNLQLLVAMIVGILSFYLLIILIGETIKEKRWKKQRECLDRLEKSQKIKRSTNKKVYGK